MFVKKFHSFAKHKCFGTKAKPKTVEVSTLFDGFLRKNKFISVKDNKKLMEGFQIEDFDSKGYLIIYVIVLSLFFKFKVVVECCIRYQHLSHQHTLSPVMKFA
jgi:hypothetical protein